MSTSATSPRSLAAPLLIAAVVIAGAHMMLVDPAKRTLAQARANTAQLELDAKRLRAIQSALPDLTAISRQAALEAADIERGNTPARDTGVLFAALAQIASTHHVRVDQLDPFTPRQSSPPSPAPAAATTRHTSPAGATPPEREIQLGYSMTVVATYSDLAEFLRTLQTDLGYTRILSVRIAPSPEGPETVTARIQSVHHAFALPRISPPENRP